MDTPIYLCDLCGTPHERATLMQEGMQLICSACWTERFEERFEPPPAEMIECVGNVGDLELWRLPGACVWWELRRAGRVVDRFSRRQDAVAAAGIFYPDERKRTPHV